MEKWINYHKENLSPDSIMLFQEAQTCYNVKAHRASLLFSYVGFCTVIKEVIVSSKKPQNIQQSRWDDIINLLNDEDKWEKRVYEELINSSTPIFNISDSIRRQIKYWKDRRNDCAHYKENDINNSHVESFWSFIKSNLSKITIEGGEKNLLNKINIHFDETKTPPNADYKPLFKEIDSAVQSKNATYFFKEFTKIIKEKFWYNEEKISNMFYDLILIIKNKKIHDSLIKFILSQENNFALYLIKYNSQFLDKFRYKQEDIRNIWKVRLKNEPANLKYIIISLLLRKDLIPKDQIRELMESLFKNFNQTGFANLPTDEQTQKSIADDNLLEIIYNHFFKNNDIAKMAYQEINSRADLITLLFKYRDIDKKMVKGILAVYQKDLTPNWLTDNIGELFASNNAIKLNFEKICESEKLNLPEFMK